MRGFDRTWQICGALVLGLSGCSESPSADDPAQSSSSTGEPTPGTSTGEDQSTGEAACMGPWEAGYVIEMPQLPPGDPDAGYRALITEDYVSCGIPWDLFGVASGVLGEEEPLPGREGKNAQVGHSWTVVEQPDGSELVVSNCLQCHAGRFNGELIVGLGKVDYDGTDAFDEILDPIPPLLETSDANIAFNKFKERVSTLGPFGTMATIGANPAVMYAIVLLAHRDPETLAWSDEPQYELLPDRVLPADPPPWWRAAKKATHFSNGMSRGDHRGTMILASSLCTDTVEEASEMLDYFADIQAYLASLEAPDYPFAIDAELAAQGQEIFECDCAGCHGTYDADPATETYPNLLIPTAVIGTDSAFADYAGPGGAYNHLEERFNDSFYGTVSEVVTAAPEPGYTAPPLDGIWATAPFLHNGSVPTLALVLDSTARPTYWRRVDYDSTNFDEQALGWPWEESPVGHDEAAEADRKFIYDTTLFGYGNGGHSFGDHLDDEQRRAVLEYLKTL
ncbi:MAG: hypothetical protein AAF799_37355 [Myxococcota bacterium]